VFSFTLVAGFLVYVGARIARIEEPTYGRSVLAAALAMIGGLFAAVAGGTAIGYVMGGRAAVAGFFAALVVSQIAIMAKLLDAPLGKAALAWGVGILIPMLVMYYLSLTHLREQVRRQSRADMAAIASALSTYAVTSGGELPPGLDALELKDVPATRLGSYGYISGLSTDGDAQWPVAFEPQMAFATSRVYLALGGEIREEATLDLESRIESALDEARARGLQPVLISPRPGAATQEGGQHEGE